MTAACGETTFAVAVFVACVVVCVVVVVVVVVIEMREGWGLGW